MVTRRHLVCAALILTIFVVDQLTKLWVLGLLEANGFRPIEVTSFFNLVLVINTGVSFGMFSGSGNEAHWLLILLPGLVVVWLGFWLWRADNWVLALGLASIMGGALGNIIDRTYRPGVIDFFDFHVAGWHFWAFNIADSAISVGVALILFDALFGADRTKADNDKATG